MTKLVRLAIAGSLMVLFGCATSITEDDGQQALRTYGPGCERAGFVANTSDWERCAYFNAGYFSTRSPETLEQRLMRLYGERCQIAGFKVGTGSYGQCMLAYADRDQAQRQALAAAFLIGQQAAAAKPAQIQMPTFTQVTCTSIHAGAIVQVSCR